LDFITYRIDDANPVDRELLMTVLDSLRLATSQSQSKIALKSRLKQLVNLRSVLSDVPILEDMISAALNASLPIGHDGFSRNLLEPCSLAFLTSCAETRSFHFSEAMVEDDQFRSFLIQEAWWPSTVQIISSLLYYLPSSRSIFLRWLDTDNPANRSAYDLAHVLHAFLDASVAHCDELTDQVGECLVPQCSHLFANVVDQENSTKFRILCSSCIVSMLTLMPSKKPEFLSLLESKIQLLPADSLTSQLLVIGNRLHSTIQPNDLISSLVNHGLQWAVRHLSGDDHDLDDAQNIFRELSASISHTG
jgi:nucleolar pre-ribosomal-associated protein 1